ncbi:MAG: MFS transporter [Natronomonas sp.]
MVDDGGRPWGLLAACFLASVGYNAYLIAPASILPLLAESFDTTATAAGWAVSAAYLGWLLLQLPGGVVLDRIDNRLLLAVGTVVLACAAVGGWLAGSYRGFLAWRVLGGATAVALFTGGVNVVSASFPATDRGFVSAVFVGSAPVGFAIAQFGGPLIADIGGWPLAIVAYPIVGLLAVPWLYRPTAAPIRAETQLSPREYLTVLTQRSTILVSLASGGTFALFVFLNAWMPTYGTDVIDASLAGAGAAAALLAVSGVVGRPAGGWISDRIGYRRRPVVLAAMLASLPVLAVVGTTGSYLVFAALLFGLGFLVQAGLGVYFIYVRELAADGAAGTNLAILMTVSIAGALSAPVVGGWLIETIGWRVAFLCAGVAAGISAVCVYLAPDSRS